MSKLLHITNLILGDWSHDGHGWTENFTIESNLTYDQIQKALTKGEKLVGVTLDDVAAEYEDSYLYFEDWEKLVDHGFTLEALLKDDGYNKEHSMKEAKRAIKDKDALAINEENFLNIFFFLVEKGNPEFRYKIIDDTAPTLKLGGYGLFSH